MAYSIERCQNGHPLLQGAAFCEVCGIPRAVSVPGVHAVCVNGHPLLAGSGFCGTCGGPLAQSLGAPAQRSVPYSPAAQYQPNYGYQYQVGPGPANNGMAIASMVLGIVWIYWIGSVLAVVFGFIALNQIGKRNESGRGMAIAGLVLGFVGIAILLILIIAGSILANNNGFNSG
jgi:hypothetical protein